MGRRGVGGALAAVGLALVGASCNSVLGIESAELNPNFNNTDGGRDTGPDPLCALTGDTCRDCVANNCCAQLSACINDKGENGCEKAVAIFNFYNGTAKDWENAVIALDRNIPLGAALRRCIESTAFCDTCKTNNRTLGTRDTTCSEYGRCMNLNCNRSSFLPDGGSFELACFALSQDLAICRRAHCAFSANYAADSADRATHCGHAVGRGLCPP